jgi:hypothetical protein
MAAGQELAITANGTAPYGVNFQARNSLSGGGGSGTSYPIIFNPLGGNVGIGIASPSTILHILDTSANDSTLTIGTTGEVPAIKAGGTNTDLKLEAVGSGGNLYFYTNTTMKMIVNSSGNVGIGTTSPQVKLDLQNGNVGFYNNTASSNGAQLYLGDMNFAGGSYSTSAPGIGSAYNSAQGVAGDLALYVYASVANSRSEAMRIKGGTGNVLIGTTTDAGYKLAVVGTNGAYFSYSSSSTYFRIRPSASNGTVNLQFGADGGAAPDLIFSNDANGEKMRIANGGAVTILNLAGTGSRAVLADASGVLSAPVSDSSVKENIKPLDYGIATIMKLKPVLFEYIKSYKNYGQGKQIGNIAQDMAKVIPEAVFTTPSTGKMGINYDQLNGVYIKALQELQEQINSLKLEIQTLENK